jgi:hypothetical protein
MLMLKCGERKTLFVRRKVLLKYNCDQRIAEGLLLKCLDFDQTKVAMGAGIASCWLLQNTLQKMLQGDRSSREAQEETLYCS